MATSDKRKIILKAVEKVLKDRRLDEVTMDQVAETAGVGKGTVYRYFEDKEDLFFQMIQVFLKDESDAVAVVAASALPPREKLIKVGETISEQIQLHGQYIRMMHAQHNPQRKQPGPHAVMREHHERLDRILSQLFHDAEKAGLLRQNIDHETLLCVYKGTIFERAMRSVHMSADVPVAQLIDLILQGVGQID